MDKGLGLNFGQREQAAAVNVEVYKTEFLEAMTDRTSQYESRHRMCLAFHRHCREVGAEDETWGGEYAHSIIS